MGTSFEVGTALNPYLAQLFVKTLIDTFEPKGTRHQRQQQEALAKLAEYEPRVSKMSEGGKKDFYNQFFRAYGMSQAPLIRGLFGAGPEPILPLPEGATEKGQFVKGPLGVGGRMQTQYTLPKTDPFKFEREEPAPLMHPVHEKELRAWDFSTEDIRDLLKKEPSQQHMIIKAQKAYTEAIQGGASEEEALEATGNARTIYEDYLDDRRLKKQQIEAGIRAKEESARLGTEREKRLTDEGKVKRTYMEAQIDIDRAREARLAKNAGLASQAKNQQALLALAQKAFAEDRRAAITQNRLELDKAVKAQMMGETYLKNEIPVPLDFNDWLENDGRAFRERFQQLGGGEGAPPSAGGGPPIPTPGAKPGLTAEDEVRKSMGLKPKGGVR